MTTLEKKMNLDLYKEFSHSRYGKTLEKNTRFDGFRQEDTSRKEWMKLLGRDVNNLYHLNITRSLTKWFLAKNDSLNQENDNNNCHIKLNLEQKENLILAATIHDWQEAIVGDTPLPLKNQQTEELEKQILLNIIAEFASYLKNPHLYEILEKVVENIIFNNDSLEGKIFHLIEVLGYQRIALISWNKKDSVTNPQLKAKLVKLATEVTKKNYLFLTQQSKIFPSIAYFLSLPKNKKSLSEIRKLL